MSGHETWIERQIREATERGEFDDLPGAGKPLEGLDDPDPDWWVRRKMAAEGIDASDALPPALLLRKERAGFPQSLAGLTSADAVREVLRDYNARVLEERRRPTFDRMPPVLAPTVDVEEVVEQWRRLRPAPPPADEPHRPEAASGRRRRWWRRLRG